MQSSPSSKSDLRKALIKAATWLMRIVVGCVFVFSGFVKAVDPWGSLYKFEEYMSALGMHMPSTVLLVGVYSLCALEFCLGIFLLLGCYRRSTPIVTMGVMAVMLPLTLWIAIADPVADCGCFGEALVISNWATFWKNVVICAMVAWLIVYNRRALTIISPAFQWMALIFSVAYVVVIASLGYFRQPLVDFRNYPVGENIIAFHEQDEADDATHYSFIYEKDGVQKEFSETDELPDENDGWNFVERRETKTDDSTHETVGKANAGADDSSSVADDPEDEKTFMVWDREGLNDVTSDVILSEGSELILMMPELGKVSPAQTWKINELYDWAFDNDVDMIAVVSGSADDIARWEDISMPEYDIFTADDTAIKEVVRGNPAIVMLRDGVIQWKTTLSSLDIDALKDSIGADGKVKDSARRAFISDVLQEGVLKNYTMAYIAVLAFLIAISFVPRLGRAFSPLAARRLRMKREKGESENDSENEYDSDTDNDSDSDSDVSRDDKAHHEE